MSSMQIGQGWSVRAGGGGRTGVKPVEKVVQLICPLCVPLDCSSSTILLEASDLSHSTPNILGLVPPQLLLQFPPVAILTLSESVFEFYLVPLPERLHLSVEKTLRVTGYPGFVVWVTVDTFSGNDVVHSEPNILRHTVHNAINTLTIWFIQYVPISGAPLSASMASGNHLSTFFTAA